MLTVRQNNVHQKKCGFGWDKKLAAVVEYIDVISVVIKPEALSVDVFNA